MRNRFLVTPFFLDEPSPDLLALARPGWQIYVPELGQGDKMARMSTLHRGLADLVSAAVRAGERPVGIAGDCCTAIGFLAGLQRAGLKPTLIWFDAHGDFNTWETTPSGFLGGMPLAMIVGRGEQTLVEGAHLENLPEDRVILTDARDLDPDEREALQASSVHHLPEVRTLLDFPLPDGPLYIHFDTDVVNAEEAPAMTYLAPGGPSSAELKRVFEHLSRTGRVVAASLSSWDAELDGNRRTEQACMDLLKALVGEAD